MQQAGTPGRMDRRRFLGALAAGTAGGLGTFGAVACGRPQDAAAHARLERIGLQLYTVRGLMAQDAVATLHAVAGIGYGEVETAGLFDIEPSRFRDALDAAGLVSPAAHVSIDALRAEPAAVFAGAQALGQTWLVVPWIAVAERTPDGYRRFAADLNAVGAAARGRGMRAAYHNHDFEFERLADGRTGYDVLLAETDPALVDMELDLFWTVKGGHDPVALFEASPGRFPLWHVKDMRDPAGAQEMVDVGAGDIDFARILGYAGTAGLRHAFIEHDNPADPIESIGTAYAHLRRLIG